MEREGEPLEMPPWRAPSLLAVDLSVNSISSVAVGKCVAKIDALKSTLPQGLTLSFEAQKDGSIEEDTAMLAKQLSENSGVLVSV